MLRKVLGAIGITLWIIGASLMDSDQMGIPVAMTLGGLMLFAFAYFFKRRTTR